MDPKVTAAIIAKDEEKIIRRCIENLRGAVDEVLLYDTGSTDTTRKISKEAGARVECDGPWEKWNFAEARNRAAELASNDWILVIDADEVIHRGEKEIRDCVRRADDSEVRCLNVRWRQKAERGWVRGEVPRVYHRRVWAYRFRIHNELFPLNGKMTALDNPTLTMPAIEIEHLPDPSREAPRFSQTLTLLEEAVQEEPLHIDAHRYLSEAYLRTEQFEKAAKAARRYLDKARGIKSHLELSEGWCFVARAETHLGHDEVALDAFNTAVRIAPERREPLWEAACLLGKKKRWSKAVECLRRLLAIPERAKPYYHFTWEPVWSNMPHEALAAFEEEAMKAGTADQGKEMFSNES